MAPSGGQTFKVKLKGGRVLGPLDLERVRRLILKEKITGQELARRYPEGDWVDISQIPELGELLMAKLAGRLEDLEIEKLRSPEALEQASTQILGGQTRLLPGADEAVHGAIELRSLSDLNVPKIEKEEGSNTIIHTEPDPEPSAEATKTKIEFDANGEIEAPTGSAPALQLDSGVFRSGRAAPAESGGAMHVGNARNISHEKTVVFQRSTASGSLPGKRKATPWDLLRATLIAVALGYFGYDTLIETPPPGPLPVKTIRIRPALPKAASTQADPQLSQKLYEKGMKFYVDDTVVGYAKAAEAFLQASSRDIGNVRALAMLASCYLNLIDSSNKDENYFSVIAALIEMSRAKSIDLPETVIADVEFFITTNKPEAAQARIVEYTRTHKNFGTEMFFYLAYAFQSRGDSQSAARYLSQFPDNRIYSARIFHLRGRIAESLGSLEDAMAQYRRGIEFNPRHVRSRLRLSALLAQTGQLEKAAPHLKYIIDHRNLISPVELAQTFYLSSQRYSLERKWELALGDIERAARLDRSNHDYLLELYTLRGKMGDNNPNVRREARMYYFLGEGERILKEGRFQDALLKFMEARQANLDSALPLVKIGDMFMKLGNVADARMNYEGAVKRSPRNIEILSKYINTLIESYEWEDARKAISRLRSLQVGQSAVQTILGDLAQKQGQYAEAQVLYKKAMQYEVIDPKVYLAYARNLMALKDYKAAAFFFSLALRLDPLSSDAIIGIARSIAYSDSLDRAISMLQDELTKGSAGKAELLAHIAELQIQKGEWELAQATLNQAMEADPELAYPWKLQALIYRNQEGRDKKAQEKALDAYKSYSDRNRSDPSGYLERYQIYLKRTEYEKATEELDKVYAIYPKYPNLHYFRGVLYSSMGNHKVAVQEFGKELELNPSHLQALMAVGNTLLQLGGAQQALEAFNKAMLLAPNNPEPKQLSGYANYLLKNYQGAIALYNAALAFDQANPLIYKRLGMAYRELGDRNAAAKAFRKYLEMEPDAVDRAEFQKFL